MANTNSVVPFDSATLEQTAESIGITRFQGLDSWDQLIGGIQFQGGSIVVPATTILVVTFPAPYRTQVLGVFIQPIDETWGTKKLQAVTFSNFEINNPNASTEFYWWAIGV